jgi:hypothetical protein
MTGDPPERPAPDGGRDGLVSTGLGPPGWRDFQAARRRFETTLAIQGLERALAVPGAVPDPPRIEPPS